MSSAHVKTIIIVLFVFTLPLGAHALSPGQYDLRLTQGLTKQEGPAIFDLSLRAKLMVSAAPGGARVGRLMDVTVSLNGHVLRDGLAQELMGAFHASFDENGTLQALRTATSNPVAQGILLSLLTDTQFGSSPVSVRLEPDGRGQVYASYGRDGDAITKRRLAYATLRTRSGLEVAGTDGPLIVESRGRMTSNRFSQLDRLVLHVGTEKVDLTTSTRLVRTGSVAPVDARAAVRPVSLHRLLTTAEVDTSDESVARMLTQNVMDAGTLAQLVRVLRARPSLASTIERRARTVTGDQRAILLHALRDSGKVEGSHALLNLGDRQALEQLAMSQTVPDSRVADRLWGIATSSGPNATTAIYAYGAQARLAPVLVERLIARYGSMPTERRIVMNALGNSGSEFLVPLAKDALSTGRPTLREAAASALRFVDSPRADTLLRATVDSDADDTVRLAAVAAIRFRDVTRFSSTLSRAALTDSSAPVREAAVRLLRRLPMVAVSQ